MLRLLGRRAAVQWPVLVAAVLVVTIGATLLGLCALLLTGTRERALEVGMSRVAPADVELTGFAAGVEPGAAAAVTADVRRTVTAALAPFRSTSAARVSTAMRRLDPGTAVARRVGYLSGMDGLPQRARLTAGRWPRPATGGGAVEAVVLEPTARRLGLTPGRTVILGPEVPPGRAAAPVRLRVVGLIRPRPDAGWDRDPLAAKGFDPAYFDGGGLQGVPAFGPFVVPLPDLFAGGSTVDRVQVTGRPELSAPTARELAEVDVAVRAADGRLARAVGARVSSERVASNLPAVYGRARARQAATDSLLLVVVVIGTALTGAALGLAGRLVAGLRADETALLTAFGAGRPRLALLAAAEAVGVSAVAALLAVPASSAAHAGLTRLPPLARAGLAAPAQVTAGQVVTVTAGALLFAGLLVVPVLLPSSGALSGAVRADRGTPGLLARTGADAVLLALAAVGWWQLRARPAGPEGVDAVRVLAPVLCLLAGAALALRMVPLPLRLGDRLARRSRGAVLPLAVFEAARRPRAVAAGLLLTLAAAAGVFGLVLGSTWDASQRDQADAATGTDLAVTLDGDATAGQGAAVAAAAGGVVSPVTDRAVVVGQYVGDAAGNGIRLLAVDAARSAELLRGRPPVGSSWASVGAGLRSRDGVAAVPLGAVVSVSGTSPPGPRLQVTPRLVLQDRSGLRLPCELAAVPLDGRAHRRRVCQHAAGTALVATRLQVDLAPASPPVAGSTTGRMEVELSVPGADAAGAWTATPEREETPRLSDATVTLSGNATGTVIRAGSEVVTDQLGQYQNPPNLLLTGYRPTSPVPAAVSRRLADVLDVRPGSVLPVAVGAAAVTVRVTRVLPALPAAPGAPAILADGDTLSRALIAAGRLEPAVDAWWVGDPGAHAASRLRALGLGPVTARAEEVQARRRGPLAVGFPAALGVLVVAVLLLVLAGTAMHVTADVEARTPELARLRALGLARRGVLAGVVLQHCGVLALLLLGGGAAGALVAGVVAPSLIRSDVGAAPVPPVLIHWAPGAVAGLTALLLVAAGLVAALAIGSRGRRLDPASLRVAR